MMGCERFGSVPNSARDLDCSHLAELNAETRLKSCFRDPKTPSQWVDNDNRVAQRSRIDGMVYIVTFIVNCQLSIADLTYMARH